MILPDLSFLMARHAYTPGALVSSQRKASKESMVARPPELSNSFVHGSRQSIANAVPRSKSHSLSSVDIAAANFVLIERVGGECGLPFYHAHYANEHALNDCKVENAATIHVPKHMKATCPSRCVVVRSGRAPRRARSGVMPT